MLDLEELKRWLVAPVIHACCIQCDKWLSPSEAYDLSVICYKCLSIQEGRQITKVCYPVLVLAGNYKQYRHWCEDNQLNHLRDAHYINDEYQIRGVPNAEILLVGTYYERNDCEHILRCAKAGGITLVGETGSPTLFSKGITK